MFPCLTGQAFLNIPLWGCSPHNPPSVSMAPHFLALALCAFAASSASTGTNALRAASPQHPLPGASSEGTTGPHQIYDVQYHSHVERRVSVPVMTGTLLLPAAEQIRKKEHWQVTGRRRTLPVALSTRENQLLWDDTHTLARTHWHTVAHAHTLNCFACVSDGPGLMRGGWEGRTRSPYAKRSRFFEDAPLVGTLTSLKVGRGVKGTALRSAAMRRAHTNTHIHTQTRGHCTHAH